MPARQLGSARDIAQHVMEQLQSGVGLFLEPDHFLSQRSRMARQADGLAAEGLLFALGREQEPRAEYDRQYRGCHEHIAEVLYEALFHGVLHSAAGLTIVRHLLVPTAWLSTVGADISRLVGSEMERRYDRPNQLWYPKGAWVLWFVTTVAGSVWTAQRYHSLQLTDDYTAMAVYGFAFAVLAPMAAVAGGLYAYGRRAAYRRAATEGGQPTTRIPYWVPQVGG